ncbi:MAG TPA: urate hydroxylase PuuD [Steroidobacteraceae bacterium]|nr:urate hydroxylase PuuD [Steroidobacteraceae bacterium]
MNAYVLDWLALFGRWIHLVTGIAWIGSSFYFVWLDNHLLKPASATDAERGVGGELWSVHGGGFYHAQKYKLAPPKLPGTLHWFYWEAYSTLLSGLFLLGLLYYGQAAIYLIDPQVAALSPPVAIAIGVAFLIGGWLVYDTLCRTPLSGKPMLLAAIVAALLSTAAWGLCHLFSGRGAFIQFGAMLGTIMVANVFFVIIPGQRRTVKALSEGREPNPLDGQRGKLRSVHNTYFTLPVLFTMISNHYATTFGARWNWLVLIALCAAGALIRAWFVARHFAAHRGGRTPPWTLLAGVLLLLGTAWALRPRPAPDAGANANAAASVSPDTAATVAAPPLSRHDRARQILQTRCVVCHAAKPTFPGFPAPPKGLTLEDDSQIPAKLPLLVLQVENRVMPIGNLTNMTDIERAELLSWFKDGAPR